MLSNFPWRIPKTVRRTLSVKSCINWYGDIYYAKEVMGKQRDDSRTYLHFRNAFVARSGAFNLYLPVARKAPSPTDRSKARDLCWVPELLEHMYFTFRYFMCPKNGACGLKRGGEKKQELGKEGRKKERERENKQTTTNEKQGLKQATNKKKCNKRERE